MRENLGVMIDIGPNPKIETKSVITARRRVISNPSAGSYRIERKEKVQNQRETNQKSPVKPVLWNIAVEMEKSW